MTTWYRRVTLPALTVILLIVTTVGAAVADDHTTPTDDPVQAAAGWLSTQLVDGERMEVAFGDDVFPDQGLTADVVFALAGADVAAGSIDAATDWLETQVGAYTGTDFGGVFAGATAKLVLVAATTGRDASSFGGVDLVAQLEGREQDSGRFTDDGSDDFSNTITQSLALLALHRTTSGPSDAAIDYLVDEACGGGGFPIQLEQGECTPEVDATAFAVQALLAVGGPDATEAADDAVAWLADVQASDGSFASPDGTNTNSTGLAALALALGGEGVAADDARAWVLALQFGCDDDAPGAISFAMDDPGDVPRATAQAVPGLTGVGLASVSDSGASTVVPELDCAEPVRQDTEDDEEIVPEDDEIVPEDDDILAEADEKETLPRTGTVTSGALTALAGAGLLGAGALLVLLVPRRRGEPV